MRRTEARHRHDRIGEYIEIDRRLAARTVEQREALDAADHGLCAFAVNRCKAQRHVFEHFNVNTAEPEHHHRAEHWVVVRGTAEVTIDDTVQTLSENQSIYIPLGAVHRLANPGRILLEVIEVQTGSYLGEDDIIRLADEWNRA